MFFASLLRRFVSAAAFVMALAASGIALAQGAGLQTSPGGPFGSTADHRQFKELAGPFDFGETSKACLGCHNLAARQLHQTGHWTWEVDNPRTGQKLGKKNVINNFFGSVKSNIKGCATCHISFRWVDDKFDFADEEQVDCLICHDTTGQYAFEKFHFNGVCDACHDERPKKKMRDMADLAAIAQRVGRTNRASCGACHFNGGGGGGDGAKHGDLDSSLLEPAKSLDVHMDVQGRNFTCATCHRTGLHVVRGSLYAPTPVDTKGVDGVGGARATCQSCHGNAPMKDARLNRHTGRIACQTCHIPRYARGGVPTLTSWDWSTAGKRDPLVERDAQGRATFVAHKGDLRWRQNLVPDYVWFNGAINYTLPGDTINHDAVVPINAYLGNAGDPASRIFPVKVMRGRQPYDTVHNTLAVAHLVGGGADAYWAGFNWDQALATGMKQADIAFSGKYGFVDTQMLWPLNHMVAPARDALSCDDCHAAGGRLAKLEGVYIPGRDAFSNLDKGGIALLALMLAAVLVHGLLRGLFRILRRRRS